MALISPVGLSMVRKRALGAGLLFELDAHGIVPQFLNGELGKVTHFQEIARFLAAGPGEFVGKREFRGKARF